MYIRRRRHVQRETRTRYREVETDAHMRRHTSKHTSTDKHTHTHERTQKPCKVLEWGGGRGAYGASERRLGLGDNGNAIGKGGHLHYGCCSERGKKEGNVSVQKERHTEQNNKNKRKRA